MLNEKLKFRKQYLRSALDLLSPVQLDPGVPAVSVQGEFVPLVQQDVVLRPHHSYTGPTVESVTRSKSLFTINHST